MRNERLRAAMDRAGVTTTWMAERVGTDPKTVERWVNTGRKPHRRNAFSAAQALGLEVQQLWPEFDHAEQRGPHVNEVITVYGTRSEVPVDLWYDFLSSATESVDVLAYAALFLSDNRSTLPMLLKDKAEHGVRVRLLLGDPESPAVSRRGTEEGVHEAMASRIRLTLASLTPALVHPGVEMRLHGETLYHSLFRFDGNLMANTHVYGFPASHNPVLHIRDTGKPGMYHQYMASFDRVWERGEPAIRS